MKITKYERLDVIEIPEDVSGYTLITDVVRCLNESLDKGATLVDIGYLHPIKIRQETDEEYKARTTSQADMDRESLRYHSYKVRELQKKLGL